MVFRAFKNTIQKVFNLNSDRMQIKNSNHDNNNINIVPNHVCVIINEVITQHKKLESGISCLIQKTQSLDVKNLSIYVSDLACKQF